MATAHRTCFVISPIGPEGSDIRRDANDFLELLVEPALEKYGFTVTRADQIAHPTAITTDIIRLVQESDLCLVDLSNSNPNVFYECGRRHETGKPFIQLIQKGLEHNLPFDVAGIRTVIYDVSSTRASRESVLKLQSFIDSIVSSGFKSATSGESLSSIAQGIERIERKLTNLLSSTSTSASLGDELEITELTQAPPTAFINALRKGKIERAYSLLDRIKAMGAPDSRTVFVGSLRLLCSTGHAKSFERLDSEMQNVLTQPEQIPDANELFVHLLEGSTAYFKNTGKLLEGIKYHEALYGKVSPMSYFNDEAKSVLANKVGMLGYAADLYDIAEKFTKLAIAISNEPSYWYNLALIYRESNQQAELDQAIRSLSEFKDLDEDHKRLLSEYMNR